MADVTSLRTGWMGLLIPEALTLTCSTGDQAGGHVGPAEPDADNDGDMVVRTLRTERAAAVDDVTIRAVTPGGVATSGLPVELEARVGAGGWHRWMDPTLAWGQEYYSADLGPLRISRYGGLAYATSAVFSDDLASWADAPHDICPAGDGELLHVQMSIAGEAWVILTELVRQGSVVRTTRVAVHWDAVTSTSTVTRLRVAWRDGSALLLATVRAAAGSPRDRLLQWASDDGGTSWVFVGTSAGAATDIATSVGDITVSAGAFVVAWANQDYDGDVLISRMASPWEPVWSAGWVQLDLNTVWDAVSAAYYVSDLNVALLDVEDGTLWILGATYSAAADTFGSVARSVDGGVSWQKITYTGTASKWEYWDSAIGSPDDMDAAWLGLSACVVGSWASDWYRIRLGGWSARGQSPATYSTGTAIRVTPGHDDDSATVGWELAWQAYGTAPGSAGWTAAGTATETLSDEDLVITEAGGARTSRTYSGALTASTDQYHVVAVHLVGAADGPRTDSGAPIVVEVTCTNGTSETYSVRIAIGDDEVAVYQRTAAAVYAILGSAETHAFGSAAVEWYIVVQFDFTGNTARSFICGRAFAALSLSALDGWDDTKDTGAVAVTNIWASVTAASLLWGSHVAAGETATHYGIHATDVATDLAVAWPDECPGRPVGRSGRLLAPSDVHVEVLGGQAEDQDNWTVSTAYDGSVDHLADPDPRRLWYSGSSGAAVITATHRPIGGTVYGVLLKGWVSEGITVRVRDAGTGSWSAVTIDRTIDGLTAGRTGTGLLRPAATSSTALLLRQAELDGAWVSYDTRAVQILSTHQGKWIHTATAVRAALQVLVDSGTASSGAMVIYPRDLLLLVTCPANGIDGVEITLAAGSLSWPKADPYEGERLLAGEVHVIGDDSDWRSSIRTDVRVQVDETPDGRMHATARLPRRRTFDVGWTDGGVDTTTSSADSDTPDWWGTDTSATPAGAVASTPWHLEGLLGTLEGEAGDLVLIHRVPTGTLDAASLASCTLQRRHEFALVNLVGPVQLDTVQGEEHVDQVIRVAAATFRERV